VSVHFSDDQSSTAMPVTVSLAGHRLIIRPTPSCLGKLGTLRLQASPGSTAVEPKIESLLFQNDPFANAGLLEAIESLLRRDGINFETDCYEPAIPPLEPPCTENIVQHGATDPAWLQIAHLWPHCLIRYGLGCSPVRFIEQVARAYPDATLAIATSRETHRNRIADQLRKRGIELSKAYTSRAPANDSRIVVGTWYGLAHPEVESWQRTFLFVPNAFDAIHARARDFLLQAGARFRLFGFLPMDQKLSPRERDLLACVFGLNDLVIPEHGRLPRPVGVIWRRFRHRPCEMAAGSAFDYKLAHFWRNPARNRLVQRIVQFFSSQRTHEEQFSHLGQTVTENRPVRALTLLTESVEHAIELGALLPDFPIVVDAARDVTGLSPRQRTILEHGAHPRTGDGHPHLIMTTRGLTAARLGFTEILVWAGAGKSPPILPAAGLLGTLEERRPLLFVDINDTGTKRIAANTGMRRNAYERRSWFAPGESYAQRRIDLFLAQRPPGGGE
jgi:hypothetical protein